MPRHLLPIAAGLAAVIVSSPAWAQAAVGETAPAPNVAAPAPRAIAKPHRPPAPRRIEAAKPASDAAAATLAAAPPARGGQPGNASGLAAALAPDLNSSIGIPKTIFVQRFVAESLNRFDRENRQSFTLEQLNQSVSNMEKTVREGAYRWWSEADRTKSGRIGRDDAQAASVDQFRKLTGLRADQTETKQQTGIRESFERGAAQQFSRYDVDGDGFVVRQEVDRRIAEEIERIERSARIARALVEDGSHGRKGFLDRDKATLLLSNVFDALDANRDGTLGSDEVPNAPKRTAPTPATAVLPPAKRVVPAQPAALASTGVARPAPTHPTPTGADRPPAVATTTPPAPARQHVARPAPTVHAKPQAPASATGIAETPSGAPAAAARPPVVRPRTAAPAKTPAVAQRPAPDAELFAQPLPTVRNYPVKPRAQPRPAEASAQ